MAANRTLGAPDLLRLGYVEEEYIVSGNANVYDWLADGSLKVIAANGIYGTRILVRRPVSSGRFSGNVVVEILNNARRYDWAMMWGYMHDGFIERGDAWIGVTMPGGVAGLTKFNPTRYAGLSFTNPSGRFIAVQHRQADIHEDHVGLKSRRRVNRRETVIGRMRFVSAEGQQLCGCTPPHASGRGSASIGTSVCSCTRSRRGRIRRSW